MVINNGGWREEESDVRGFMRAAVQSQLHNFRRPHPSPRPVPGEHGPKPPPVDPTHTSAWRAVLTDFPDSKGRYAMDL